MFPGYSFRIISQIARTRVSVFDVTREKRNVLEEFGEL